MLQKLKKTAVIVLACALSWKPASLPRYGCLLQNITTSFRPLQRQLQVAAGLLQLLHHALRTECWRVILLAELAPFGVGN